MRVNGGQESSCSACPALDGWVEWPGDNKAFLGTVFGERWPRAHVCAIGGDPSERGVSWAGGPASKLIGFCRATSNNYFVVSLFRGPQRQSQLFDGLFVLGVDDVGPKIDPGRVLEVLGPPSWRIETSPGNEQWGYRLKVPLHDARKAKALIHSVRVRLTGVDAKDPGMESITRYLRLPRGMNLKASVKQAGCPDGFVTRLLLPRRIDA